jgi:GAG-pre-integrase domain
MFNAVDPNGPAFPPPPVQEDTPVPPPAEFAAAQHPPGASHGRGSRSYHLFAARTTTAVHPDPASAVSSHILIDSGSSAHMCPHREWFTQIRPCAPIHILLGNDSTLVCQEEGTIHFTVHSGTHPYTFLLPHTLYAPAQRHTLISCSALSSSALHTYFPGPSCSIYDVSDPSSPVLVARSTHRDGLYFLSTPAVALSSVHMPVPDRDTSSPGALNVCLHSRTSSPNRDIDTWHSRLGHTGTDIIRSMLRTGQLTSVQNTVHCNECVLGKQHRHPFHVSIATACKPF